MRIDCSDSEMAELASAIIRRLHFNEADTLWLLALLSSKEACFHVLCPTLPTVFDHLNAILETKVPDVGQVFIVIKIVIVYIIINNSFYYSLKKLHGSHETFFLFSR